MSRVLLLAVLFLLSACDKGPELPPSLLAGAEAIDPLCFAYEGNTFPVKDCESGFEVSQRVDSKRRHSASYKVRGTGDGDLSYIEYSYLGSAGDDTVVLVKRRGEGSAMRASTLYLLQREEDTLYILKSAAGASPCGDNFSAAAKCLGM
jgi:hypothetical protein